VDSSVGVAVGVQVAAAVELPLLVGVGGVARPLKDRGTAAGICAVSVQAGSGAKVFQQGKVANDLGNLPQLVGVAGVAGPLEDLAAIADVGGVGVQAGAIPVAF
jgi:hypothetical protein